MGERLAEQADGQLPLRAKRQVLWQSHPMTSDFAGPLGCSAGDPLPRRYQRMSGLLTYIHQVHRRDLTGRDATDRAEGIRS